MTRCRPIVSLVLFGLSIQAADPSCPSYPNLQREADREARDRESAYQRLARSLGRSPLRQPDQRMADPSVARQNFIDEHIFDKAAMDGVPLSGLSSDADFLRRLYIDFTGRIPSAEAAASFLDSTDPNKRLLLIDELMATEAFVDRWTRFYADQFEVTSRYYNYISLTARTAFWNYLRDFVARDRSYAAVVQEMLTAQGEANTSAPLSFLLRGIQQGDPIQDTWDTITDRATTKFLGVKTECVSCHDGRGHLEEINLYLSQRRRVEFWRQSAFFSRTSFNFLFADSYAQQSRVVVADASAGGYHSLVSASNPGPRPARFGGPYQPAFMLTGESVSGGNYRQQLAQKLTANRQFARATVNYLWAALFTAGIVDPPNGWDLARIDPAQPPRAPWTLQPSHPALLESLADELIRNDFRIRPILRMMVMSSAYQLSSTRPEGWRPEHDRYFSRHLPRRLTAEEYWDTLTTATMTETPMAVDGFAQPLLYATQLPDPTEPRSEFGIRNFLTILGRGDYWENPSSSQATVVQALYLMNEWFVNFRIFPDSEGGRSNRVARILARPLSDEDSIQQLYLGTLSRYATAEEISTIRGRVRGSRWQWLPDVQWALLNKLDFVFQH